MSESVDKETGKKFLIPGDIVEVLDRNPSGLWLVRRISRSVEIGFVLDTILEQPKRYGVNVFNRVDIVDLTLISHSLLLCRKTVPKVVGSL